MRKCHAGSRISTSVKTGWSMVSKQRGYPGITPGEKIKYRLRTDLAREYHYCQKLRAVCHDQLRPQTSILDQLARTHEEAISGLVV